MRDIVVKYLFASQIHRLSMHKIKSYQALDRKIKAQLDIDQPIFLTYYDGDNDLITVASNQDLGECIHFHANRPTKKGDLNTIVLRFHVSLSMPRSKWPEKESVALLQLLSGDQLRDCSVKGYRCVENAMVQIAFGAEKGVMMTAESLKKLLNKLSQKLAGNDEDGPFVSRIHASLLSGDLGMVHMTPGSSLTLHIAIQNDGALPWPEDTALTLTSAANAAYMSESSFHLGSLGPGDTLEFSVQMESSPRALGRFQGFWKISSRDSIVPYIMWTKFDIRLPEEGTRCPSTSSMVVEPAPFSPLIPLEGFVDLNVDSLALYLI